MKTTFRADVLGPSGAIASQVNEARARAAKPDDTSFDEVVEALKKKARGTGPEAEKAKRMLAAMKGK